MPASFYLTGPDLMTLTSKVGMAIFSTGFIYRYVLTRSWGEGGPCITWIMLNPSTADARSDDATIRRTIGFSKKLFGATSIVVVNLFAYKATNPKYLLNTTDPIGPENLRTLMLTAQTSDETIVAWGSMSSKLVEKAKASLQVVSQMKWVKCLGKNKDGSPRHPVRLPYNLKLESWP